MRSLKDIYSKWTTGYYNIGFITSGLDSVLEHKAIDVKWLIHNEKDVWFADPFILHKDGSYIYVLVEEWDISRQKGQISRLKVDLQSFRLVSKETVLDLTTHLSFPAYFIKDGIIYLYPENSASGALFCYQYDPKSCRCSNKSLLIDKPVTDSILLEHDGKTFLFATFQNELGGNGKKTTIFEKDANGSFVKADEVFFEDNLARMAGNFFYYHRKLFRPAQESNHSYGHSVSIQEATLLNGKWHFEEALRISSPHRQLSYGFHTFNVFDNLIAVDAFGWYHPALRKLFVDDWGNRKHCFALSGKKHASLDISSETHRFHWLQELISSPFFCKLRKSL